MSPSLIAATRAQLHRRMIEERVLGLRPQRAGGPRVVNIADSDNAGSKRVAELLAERMRQQAGVPALLEETPGGGQGTSFEHLVLDFLAESLQHLPPAAGRWEVLPGRALDSFAQYRHLKELKRLSEQHEELRLYLGSGYVIRPDIVVVREPLDDASLGEGIIGGEEGVAQATFLRKANAAAHQALPVLHASVSCKWTLRSDRAQNARTEALNLIRDRKGRVPAITVVTAEPMPSRLASLADGTGDIDRVYHVALYELQRAVQDLVAEDPSKRNWQEDLARMVRGLRLADISDLPFDLVS